MIKKKSKDTTQNDELFHKINKCIKLNKNNNNNYIIGTQLHVFIML